MDLNLIRLFTFYLSAMFIVGTWRRLRQYRDIAHIAMSVPGKYPRLMAQMRKHGTLFMTWATLRPAGVALFLLGVQMICSRLIWPQAEINLRDLLDEWQLLPWVAIAAGGMIAVDGYFLLKVGGIDRTETERYLEEAEFWLTSWKAPLLRRVTFGFVDPRRIVDVEVRKAMETGHGLLKRTLWWMSLQAGLRVAFGLALWTAWAVHPGTQAGG